MPRSSKAPQSSKSMEKFRMVEKKAPMVIKNSRRDHKKVNHNILKISIFKLKTLLRSTFKSVISIKKSPPTKNHSILTFPHHTPLIYFKDQKFGFFITLSKNHFKRTLLISYDHNLLYWSQIIDSYPLK